MKCRFYSVLQLLSRLPLFPACLPCDSILPNHKWYVCSRNPPIPFPCFKIVLFVSSYLPFPLFPLPPSRLNISKLPIDQLHHNLPLPLHHLTSNYRTSRIIPNYLAHSSLPLPLPTTRFTPLSFHFLKHSPWCPPEPPGRHRGGGADRPYCGGASGWGGREGCGQGRGPLGTGGDVPQRVGPT